MSGRLKICVSLKEVFLLHLWSYLSVDLINKVLVWDITAGRLDLTCWANLSFGILMKSKEENS